MDLHSSKFLTTVWYAAFWTTPGLFLLQLAALATLLWRIAYRRQPEVLGTRPVEQAVLQLGIALAPLVMLFVSTAFRGGYQEERGHWFFHIHEDAAGLALVPFYAVGSAIVARGLARPEYRAKSGMHLVAVWTLCAISAWYAFATLFLRMTIDALQDMSFSAIFPAIASLNYALIALRISRQGEARAASRGSLAAWFTGLSVSLVAKIPLAISAFEALPKQRPDGYGDCFVVGAATRGHPVFVGSKFDPSLGRVVNHQWRTLRRFEDELSYRRPVLHRYLRASYNRIGPPLADRIRSRAAADIAFLALKPIEWAARLYLAALR